MTKRAVSVLGRSTVSVCLASLLVASLCAGDLISIDGFFDEWATVPVTFADPEADGTTEDIALLRITNDSSSLFLDLAFHSPEFTLRSQNSITLYIDTDEDAQTGLAIHGIGAELEWCLGCASGVFHQAQGAENLGRNDFEVLMAPAYTSRRFELALSLASDPLTLNGTQVPGRLSIVVVASGQGDFLPDAPGGVEYLIDSSPPQEPPAISLARLQEGHLRLMTYNTEFSGILDPDRQPFFERIITALDPDIMAFQELRNAAQVGAVIAEWLQVPLFSVTVMGNTLVSRFPILESTTLIPSGRSSAILLDTQAALGAQLLVLNTHLIPFNDAASQQDADELIRQLRAWRDGDGPFALTPNTPIFNMGDFNLFGPSQLLKTMSEGDISDENQFGEDFPPDWDGTPFQDLNSLQTGRRVSFTTSGSSGGVKLDYVFYSNSVVKLGTHYVLNTATMSQQDLLASGLQAQDTGLASDHLPKVVDIASISDPGSSEELYFAQFGDGAGLFSQIILFNLDRDNQADVSIVLRDNDGNLLSVDLNGQQVNGEKTAVIPPGGLLSWKTAGQGDLVTGSARVSSDNEVAGVILFGGAVGLAGVGNSAALPDGFVAPMEVVGESDINTGVAIVNLEDSAARLDLQLCDQDGLVLSQASIDLVGQGHVASFLPAFDWSPSVDFSAFDGLLKVTSSHKLAATVIQTRPGQFATLPVVPMPLQAAVDADPSPQGPGAGSGTELHFAQFADGGGLFSEIVLFNLDNSGPANVTIELKDSDGNPLVVDLNGAVEAGQLEAALPAGGLRRFRTDGLGDLVAGSVKVTSGAPIAGVVLFGGTIGLAGVGSSDALSNGFAAPMESRTDHVDTGIASVNLQEESTELTLQLCDAAGTLLATISQTLADSGHLAAFLSEFDWPLAVNLTDFEGTLKVTADGSIAATVIQTRPGQFATLPVVPLKAPVQTASDLVLINGTILTLDKDDSIASAVRIREGRIVAVGDDAAGIETSAQVIDLGGRTVTPGLIDSHIHYFRDAHVPGHLLSAIETVFTIPDLLGVLTARAASVPAGEFITVLGRFTAAQFAENRLPTLAELDGAAPNHPVYLHSGFSGPAVTNTLGKVSFEARGVFVNQSGTFSRGQTDPPVQALFADYTNEEALRTVREYMKFSASLGLTTIQNFSGCGGFGGQVRADILCEGNFFDLWQQDALLVRIRTSAGGFGNNPDQNGIFPVVLSTDSHL